MRLEGTCLALTGFLWCACGVAPEEPLNPELAPLEAAVSGRRLMAPRLSLDTAHAACPTTGRVICGQLPAPSDPDFPGFLRALADLEDATDQAPHVRGLAALVESVGHPDRIERAILSLEEASTLEPSAAVFADLAAAYLVRSEIRGDAVDLLRSAGAANRAIEEAPELPRARFNFALALTRLSLRRSAREAWDRFLAVEPDPAWRSEAIAFRDTVGTATYSEAPASGRERRQRALEEILPRWAELFLAGRHPEADRALAEARAVGNDLAARSAGGDSEVLATVRAIERASPTARQRLARGLVAYRRGADHYFRGEQDEAASTFSQAARDLAGTAVAAWAEVGVALATYQQGRYPAALEALDAAEARADPGRFPALAGRIAWIRGTIAVFEDRPAEAWAAYRKSADAFETAGEPESRLAVEARWASAMAALGAPREAWRRRLVLLRAAPELRDRREIRELFAEAAHAALVSGQPVAALAFLEDAWSYLPPEGDPLAEVALLRWRARVHHELGNLRAARADLAGARRRLPALPDAAHRSLVAAEVELITGELLVSDDPAAAVQAFTAAIDRFAGGDTDHLLPRAYLGRARGHRRLGGAALALADLELAVALLESRRARAGSTAERQSLLADARDVYEEAVAVAVARSEPERAFSLAEALHARTLGEAAGAAGPVAVPSPAQAGGADAEESSTVRPAFARELQRTLPTDVVLVSFLVLPESLLRWTVTREGLDLAAFEVSSRRLELHVEAFVAAVRSSRLEAVHAAGSDLAELLVPAGAPGAHLVFVPDGPLHGVPFDVLPDPVTGALLLESGPVAVAPSAALYQAALARDQLPGGSPPDSALVVADPAFPRAMFPDLPRLSEAAAEGQAIAALYRRPSLLVGEDATSERVLSELGGHDIFHVATHAVADGVEAGASYLVLSDRPLYARELAGRQLRAPRIVVLSACHTGRGDDATGEGLSGLARAFLESGSSAVVGTLWPISDSMAQRFSVSLHHHLAAGAAPAAALRATKLERLAAGDPLATWAAFELIGGTAPQEEEER